MNLVRLFDGLDVAPLIAEIEAAPDIWSAITLRTENPASPHHGIPDVWLRYQPEPEWINGAPHNGPCAMAWYPAAARLPSLKPLIRAVMAALLCDGFDITELGGLLLTHIPPGRSVKPHDDRGGWHAEAMNLKVYVPLKGDGDTINLCGGESAAMLPGEAWLMNNLVTHSVENNGTNDRWTLIICMRTEP